MSFTDNAEKLFKTALWYAKRPIRPAQVLNLFKQAVDIALLNRTTVNYTPSVMGVFINNKCNLRCRFCYFPWDRMDKRDMTVEEFKKFLDHPIFRNTIRISLTGGEPLLHPCLFEFTRLASERGMAVSLVTNGTLLDLNRDRLFACGIDSLMVSHYDECFSEVEPQLKNIVKERNRKKSGLYILLSKVISKDSYAVMGELIDESLCLGIDGVNFNLLFPASGKDAPAKLIYEDDPEISAYIDSLKSKYRKAPIDITYPAALPVSAKDIKCCVYLKNMLSVDVDGNIAPCCFMVPPDTKYGNIFARDDAFNNDFYHDLRKAFKEKDLDNAHIRDYCRNCYFAYSTPLRVI